MTADLVSLVDLLAAAEGVELVALFGPEHGLAASAQAGDEVGEAIHPRFGIPVHSLYGERRAPTEESLRGLDLLVIDLQDIGVRFFTYARHGGDDPGGLRANRDAGADPGPPQPDRRRDHGRADRWIAAQRSFVGHSADPASATG